MKVSEKLRQEYRNLALEIVARFSSFDSAVANDIPYVSQFATPEYAEKVLRGGVSVQSDPAWRDTGALTPEEYSKWAMCQCGMACTSMALRHFKKEMLPIVLLAKDALANGVYKESGNRISDMHYKEFCTWILKHGIEAQFYTRLSIHSIRYSLSRGQLVMASVNPNIRGYETALRNQKGGHLVLITGYDKIKGTITINNPSGFSSSNTQMQHTLPTKEFLRYYAGRGIVLFS